MDGIQPHRDLMYTCPNLTIYWPRMGGWMDRWMAGQMERPKTICPDLWMRGQKQFGKKRKCWSPAFSKFPQNVFLKHPLPPPAKSFVIYMCFQSRVVLKFCSLKRNK